MTATPTIAPPAITCPAWCRTPERTHDIDLDNGRAVVDHDGPRFGPYLSGGGVTFAETGGVREVDVRLMVDLPGLPDLATLSPEELLELARDARTAALWLEAQR